MVCLHVKGEPLLHPNLEEILNVCEDNNISVNITTNATLLLKNIKVILNSKSVRQLNLSLHSISQNEFDKDKYLCDIIKVNKNGNGINNHYSELVFRKDDETVRKICKIKKRLVTLCMAVFYLCCLGGNNVFANDIELKRHVEYDENGQMRVWLSGSSDKENESFVFVVLNPGYELNDIEENSKAALQYQDLVVSDEVGKFGFEFKIYGDNYGDFKVYCANDEAMVISRQNADDMKNFIDDELLMCQAVLEDTLKNKENIIALDKIDEFKSVDKEKLSERVYEKLKSLNDVSDEYTVFEKFNEIKAILNRYSVIEVFNQNIAGFEFIENNKFLYGDIIGVSEAEIKNKTSFQECFEKVLSDEGRKKVIESLMNNWFFI